MFFYGRHHSNDRVEVPTFKISFYKIYDVNTIIGHKIVQGVAVNNTANFLYLTAIMHHIQI